LIEVLISAFKIIFLLGFIILIHECGHFFMAKLCKVKVTDFAIGFGPTIFKKQGKETKYALRAIPLGGYVNMVGEQERSDEEGSFSKVSIPKRALIILAGSVVNIIFGLLVYFILVSSRGDNVTNFINELVPGYALEQAGIQEGDRLLKINGDTIRIKSNIDKAMSISNR
jgi:regulator of sigma E protease